MSFLAYTFIQKALLMALFSGATCGALGVFIVLWRIGFMGICISHAAFAGALLSLWMGFPPLGGAIAGSLGAAAIAGPMADKPTFTPDTAISIIFSVMLSLAMLALGMLPAAKVEGLNFLWGNLLTATYWDIGLMTLCSIVLVTFIWLFFKEIEATISQRQAAEASGIPTKAIYYVSLCLMGLIVAISLKAIGGMLIYALMVTPAATALQICRTLKATFWFSAICGALSSILGLWIAYITGIPTGVAVVLCATAFLLIAFQVSPKKRDC